MDIAVIHTRIKERFQHYTEEQIANNSVMDLYSLAVADVLEEVYREIDSARMPHLYSKLKGANLDDLGFMLSMPREVDEEDTQYLYRLMNWKALAETSNLTAINTSLLNRTYASHAEFIPMTNGSGTGTVYIIPKTYDDPAIVRGAMTECIQVMEKMSSGSIYIEYTIPTAKAVTLHVAISTSEQGNSQAIRNSIRENIEAYVNNVPPGKYMLVGMLNKIGVNEDMVEYFNVLQVFIDDEEVQEIEVLQKLSDKFLLKEIIWSEEN